MPSVGQVPRVSKRFDVSYSVYPFNKKNLGVVKLAYKLVRPHRINQFSFCPSLHTQECWHPIYCPHSRMLACTRHSTSSVTWTTSSSLKTKRNRMKSPNDDCGCGLQLVVHIECFLHNVTADTFTTCESQHTE